VAKKKKDHKGDQPFSDEVKAYDGKWSPLHFLTFKYLGFPAGRAHCLKFLTIVPGSGPVKKRGRSRNISATTKYSTHHVPSYLPGSEDVNSEAVRDRILQSAGRAARRVVQQKLHSDFTESKSDRDNSAMFDDNMVFAFLVLKLFTPNITDISDLKYH
jgi:hypothetical protein